MFRPTLPLLAVCTAVCGVVLFADAGHAEDWVMSVTPEATPQPTPSMSAMLAGPRGPLRAALIIGNNRSPRGALPDLQFADDDALRTTETLRTFVPDLDVVLLTRADADTARLFGDAAVAATPPTRAAVDAAVAALAPRFAQAKRRRYRHRTLRRVLWPR
jgi:hypothetical protein